MEKINIKEQYSFNRLFLFYRLFIGANVLQHLLAKISTTRFQQKKTIKMLLF